MANKKPQRVVSASETIHWVWEEDDPAAARCESQHRDINNQSLEATELLVYYGLLACHVTKQDNSTESLVGWVDRTLANILVFADDCRNAVEWLTREVVNHADEQGRRRGQRRRHLKERGLLQNGRRFVRLCGQVITDTEMIAVDAARECIDDWDETADQRTLHFHKEEGGVRWDPCSEDNDRTVTMHLGNPFTAPRATRETDGRTVQQYRIELLNEEPATAERSKWTSADGSDTNEGENKTELKWTLNKRAETAMEWLSFAAETVGDIARHSDEDTLQRLFPNLREIQRRQRRETAQKQAALATKTQPTAGLATRKGGQTIH